MSGTRRLTLDLALVLAVIGSVVLALLSFNHRPRASAFSAPIVAAASEPDFSLTVPAASVLGVDPASAADKTRSFSEQVGTTRMEVVAATVTATDLTITPAEMAANMPQRNVIGKRPYQLDGNPGYLYTIKTPYDLQLALFVRVRASMYLITASQFGPTASLPSLQRVFSHMLATIKLSPNAKPAKIGKETAAEKQKEKRHG